MQGYESFIIKDELNYRYLQFFVVYFNYKVSVVFYFLAYYF